ncbi:MAG TPA: hypothetical protein VJS64_02960 [Pyrinomonadaceae bacterium]|nr:hypothetical protein [Pyrinomonadaceae bacterium]
MPTRDEHTEEERSILAIAEADMKKRRMNLVLAMVRNPETKIVHLQTVIGGYRER